MRRSRGARSATSADGSVSLPLVPTLLALAVAGLGAVIQGSIGMGGNLVAAPLLLVIEPRFVPVPLLMAAVSRSAWVARRDRSSADWHGVRRLLAGRVPGTVAAALLIGLAPRRTFTVVFEVLILGAVALSARAPTTRRTGVMLTATGLITGFMATLTSVGGGLTGLIYKDAGAPTLRGTVAAAGAIGGVMSLVALGAVGRLTPSALLLGVLLLPSILGVPASSAIVRRIGVRTLRPLVLSVVAATAVSGLLRALLS